MNKSSCNLKKRRVIFTNQILILTLKCQRGYTASSLSFQILHQLELTAAFLWLQNVSSLRPTIQFNGLQGVSTNTYLNFLFPSKGGSDVTEFLSCKAHKISLLYWPEHHTLTSDG